MSIIVALFGIEVPVHAATVAFDPPWKTVGLNTPFSVSLTLDAKEPVNAVSLVVSLPPGLMFAGVSDGNSIVNYWVTPPRWDATARTLTLEGIVAGGYSGVGGRIALITLTATTPGEKKIAVNETRSFVYKDAPAPTQDALVARSMAVYASSASTAVRTDIPDTDPPESFTPQVVKIPDVFGGHAVLVFGTQDKGSGIDHYDVAESFGALPWMSVSWHPAQSPYVLEDQALRSTVYVRAIDARGNARTMSLPPAYPLPWYEGAAVSYMLVIAAAGLLGYAARAIRRRYA